MEEPPLSKTCLRCGKNKSLSDFGYHPKGRLQRKSQCKSCLSEQEKTARDTGNRTPRSTESVNRGNQQRRNQNAVFKAQVFEHYGKHCTCCGSTRRLTIDHIEGNGAAQRAALFGKGSASGTGKLYRWLVEHEFPPGFQTLCSPCNASKSGGDRCRLHDNATSKICTVCNQDKPLDDFHRDAHCSYGRCSQCKNCYLTRKTSSRPDRN